MRMRIAAAGALLAVGMLGATPAFASPSPAPTDGPTATGAPSPTGTPGPTATPTSIPTEAPQPTPTTLPSFSTPTPPPNPGTCVANPTTISVGQSAVVTCSGINPPRGYLGVKFEAWNPQIVLGSLSSLLRTEVPDAGVLKPISDDSASVTFTPSVAGSYRITSTLIQEDAAYPLNDVTITVVAASAELPVTGGDVPLGALISGICALALGSGAIVIAGARRRRRG